MAGHPRVTVVRDSVDKVLGAVKDMTGKQVLIGYPENTSGRDEGPMNNATIAYLMEFGSPANNIPARPSLVPGVENAKDDVAEPLQSAAKATLAGDVKVANGFLQAAGMIGVSSVKNEINTGSFAPLSPATIRARRYGRNTKSMRQSEQHYMQLVASGMTPEAAQNATGIRPLVNTGQMRNAVTYVVRKVK